MLGNIFKKIFNKAEEPWFYSCCRKWEDEFIRVMENCPLDLTNERTNIRGEFVDYIKTYNVVGGEVVVKTDNEIISFAERTGEKASYAFRTIYENEDRTQEVIQLYEAQKGIKVKDISETITEYKGANSVDFGGLPVLQELYPNVASCCDVCKRRSRCQPVEIRVCRSLQEWRVLTDRRRNVRL